MKFTLTQWVMIRDLVQDEAGTISRTLDLWKDDERTTKRKMSDLATCNAILEKLSTLDI